VAQRRRRVFVVASARNDFDPAAVLFEWDGVRRDSAPSREAGENLADRAGAGAYLGNAEGGSVDVPFMTASSQMRCVNNQTPLVGVTQPEAFVKATNPHSAEEAPRYEQTEVAACLNPWDERHNPPKHMVAVAIGLDEEQNARVEGFGTLKARMEGGGFEGTVMTPAMQVRRLTPVECERLQGFPDNYTAIPWRNKPADQCPDGPRYKALGNSWAVPVVQWIGRRIASAVEMRMAA
jgi:DNA (cytosine-5)-methyltransferase 1